MRVVDTDNEDSVMATKLIMVGRFMTGIGVPFVCVVLWANDCSGLWRSLWTQCADDPASFDANVTVRVTAAGGWEDLGISVVSHADICSPQYKGGGRCPRAVVDILGTLIFRKLIDDAFLSPMFSMFKLTPEIHTTWVYIRRLCRPGYRSTKSIDREVGGIIMLLEYPLMFGLYYPLLFPLSGIALFLHGTVFHFAIAQGAILQHDTKPSIVYLWVSLLLGMLFSMWLFNEAELGGRWLVNITMPIVTLATVWWTWGLKLQARKTEFSVALQELGESLLPSDAETEVFHQVASAHCTLTPGL